MKNEKVARELVRIARALVAEITPEEMAKAEDTAKSKLLEAEAALGKLSPETKREIKELEELSRQVEERKAALKKKIALKPKGKGASTEEYDAWKEHTAALKEVSVQLTQLGKQCSDNAESMKELDRFIDEIMKEFPGTVSKVSAKVSQSNDYVATIEYLMSVISNKLGKSSALVMKNIRNFTSVTASAVKICSDFRYSELLDEVQAKLEERNEVLSGTVPNADRELKDRGWQIENGGDLKKLLEDASARHASAMRDSGRFTARQVFASRCRKAGVIDTVVKIWDRITVQVKTSLEKFGSWVKSVGEKVSSALKYGKAVEAPVAGAIESLKEIKKTMKKLS